MDFQHLNAKQRELDFVRRAAERFTQDEALISYTDDDIEPGTMMAIKWGMDSDCVLVIHLDEISQPTVYQHAIPTRKPGGVPAGVDPFNDVFAVVTERDHTDPLKSSGRIIHEAAYDKSDLIQVTKRAAALSASYGQAAIYKLVKIGAPDECRQMIEF